MKNTYLKALSILLYTLIGFVCISGSISAHHSAEMFNRDEIVTLTGTVKEFRYINPHSWLIVDIDNDDGTITTWGFEGDAIMPRAAERFVLLCGNVCVFEYFSL